MKKKYIAPASLVIEMQTFNMLALSQVNDGTTINKGNEADFEQYSNKQTPCGVRAAAKRIVGLNHPRYSLFVKKIGHSVGVPDFCAAAKP